MKESAASHFPSPFYYNIRYFIAIGVCVALATIANEHFGLLGLISGAVVGLVGGWFLGCVPLILAWRDATALNSKSTKVLNQMVNDGAIFLANIAHILRERGADLSTVRKKALGWMISNDQNERLYGCDAINTNFPDIARQIGDFDYQNPSQEKIEIVQNLLERERLADDQGQTGSDKPKEKYVEKGFKEEMGSWLFKLLGGTVSLFMKTVAFILGIVVAIVILFYILGSLAK